MLSARGPTDPDSSRSKPPLDSTNGSDRAKALFVDIVSHELRTPLTTISGYAEFLEDELAGSLSSQQRTFVREIQRAASRLRFLVDDILDFAAVEAGTFQLARREVDVRDVVRDAASSLFPQVKEANIFLDLHLPARPAVAWVDPNRLQQILLNLINNGIKFTPKGGRVNIQVRPAEREIIVKVTDTGIGIAPEHIPSVFDKFFQVDHRLTRERGGVGLGLAISRALIEAHGGAISVESKLQHGSSFQVSFPRSNTGGTGPLPLLD